MKGKPLLTALTIVVALFMLVPLMVPILAMTVLLHNYSGSASEGEYRYLYREGIKKAAVCSYTWDPASGSTEITIPEAINGYPVRGLGGYVGKGAPSPFYVNVKNAHFEQGVGLSHGSFRWYFEGSAPKDTAVIYLDFTLNLGPNIREIFAMDAAFFGITREQGTALYIPRFYVNCDPGNSSFYSENGRLYETDGTLVEGLLYWDDDYMS